MNILIIAGHGDGDCGALGNGYEEAKLTRELALKLVPELKKYYNVTLYPVAKNCYKDSKAGLTPNYKQFDFVLELHFNAHTNLEANGTEVMIHSSTQISNLQKDIAKNVSNVGFKLRDPVKTGSLHNMNKCYAQNTPYVLLETCFISNKNDITKYKQNIDKVVSGIVKAFKDNLTVENVSRETLYRVQVGAFKNKENADKLAKELKLKGYDTLVVF